MAILVVGGNKASAKSTIVQNVAFLASKSVKTAIFDADLQGSVKNWHKRRKDNNLDINFSLYTGSGNIAEELIELEKEYELIIVDVRGSNSKEFLSAGSVADLIVVPIEPTIKLLETLDELVIQQELIKKDIYLFPVKVPSNIFVKKERLNFYKNYIADYKTLKSFDDVCITSRSLYYKLDEIGATIFESSSKNKAFLPSKNEMESLIKKIFDVLNQ